MSKPVASVDRPLALRLRPDLLAAPVDVAGATTWIVKDPLTLEHFHFSAEEYALVDLLRQPISLAQLKREFGRRFPPQSITEPEIWSFLRQLHASGLVMSDATGQGGELFSRQRHERIRSWAFAWTRLSAIRFRGVNPDRFLTALHDHCRWLLSPATLIALAALVIFAASLVFGHFAEFRARLPELSALADWRNLFWLLASIGVVKVLHELGHALACKHFGGEVPEMGLMLLVFVPCLYSDVSDAWRLPSKWQRILISAAGMSVELVIAALAAIVWWYAQPGLVQLIAPDLMIVTTVGTLAVNGNPLLRYDGYYILADLADSPNLWQRSRDVLRDTAARWFTIRPPAGDALVPARHRRWLAAYAVASKAYLAFVLVSIVWGLVLVLHPLRLENLAYALGLTLLGGAVVGPMSATARLVRDPMGRRNVRTGRLATAATIGLAATVTMLSLPVNYQVHAPLVLLPTDAARVYASVDGVLESALAAGTQVEAGQPVARLVNPAIQLEVARLTGEHELQRLRVDNLEKLRGRDPEANSQLPAARAALDDLAKRLAERRRDAQRLTLVAPAAGTVIAAPRTPSPESTHSARGRLPGWSGAILEAHNRGALVEPGTLVCLVGDPRRLSAVLVVNDTDVARLTAGQAVRLQIEQLPGRVVTGRVVEVARRDTSAADSRAPARSDLAVLLAGLVPPGRDDVHYHCRVALDLPPDAPPQLTIGARGQAKIAAERITLARWLARRFAQTFRLPS